MFVDAHQFAHHEADMAAIVVLQCIKKVGHRGNRHRRQIRVAHGNCPGAIEIRCEFINQDEYPAPTKQIHPCLLARSLERGVIIFEVVKPAQLGGNRSPDAIFFVGFTATKRHHINHTRISNHGAVDLFGNLRDMVRMFGEQPDRQHIVGFATTHCLTQSKDGLI